MILTVRKMLKSKKRIVYFTLNKPPNHTKSVGFLTNQKFIKKLYACIVFFNYI